MDDVKERSGALAKDAEAKYDAAKQSVLQARDSTEQLYDEARNATGRRANEVRGDFENAGNKAKEGWFSWKGWGKSKAEEGGEKMNRSEEDVRETLDKDKQYVARKVADSAGDVQRQAEKRA